MKETNNLYKKGTKEYKAYNKGFKKGYSLYVGMELERLKGELENIRKNHEMHDKYSSLIMKIELWKKK